MLAGYRSMRPVDKLMQVQALTETLLQLAAARISSETPGLSERELRLRVAALWLDPDLMARALGWDPRIEIP
jgi:hypothetical protein